MHVVIANFSSPVARSIDGHAYWAAHRKPEPGRRQSLFEQRVDWGFHIYAIGVHLLDLGLARSVEFWDYGPERWSAYLANGVLRTSFLGPEDVWHYLERYGEPDLFINYGQVGRPLLRRLEGRSFRVHVPCWPSREDRAGNTAAECYLVDSDEFLDDRSMLYVPVVNTRKIHPIECEKERDFVYLASAYAGKRHDLLLDAVRGTALTGHLHPVDRSLLDLSGTRVTATNWDEIDVVRLLQSSRIAVYAGDRTSNPAAMWECVAAGLPIVVNAEIAGGKHLVVSGVTGELAPPARFRETMERVLAHREGYRPRQYFERHWEPEAMIESYLAFFERMGWSRPACF
ncbi:MAG: glycosyltransferase [Candidatus Binatia bacterium]